MKIYLVGGCVRDQLLGLESGDRDWVVVGAQPEDLLAKGFKKVGAHFPVFLHPKTHEEYALARVERKQGQGYGGFTVQAGPHVSLEEDLKRRDLTINAIAYDPQTQKYIDPYHGKADLEAGILRHVSEAFSDDPLRLVRLARFATIFSEMRIADETENLIKQIVEREELKLLPIERITLEIEKTYLKAQDLSRFWELLEQWGALPQLFPSVVRRWPILLESLKKPARCAPELRLSRAIAQLLTDCGPGVWGAFLQSLSLSSKQQRLAQTTVAWWELISSDSITAQPLVKFLSQNRLFQNRDQLRELQHILDPSESPELLITIIAFVDKLADESPRLWLEQYPPQQRRERLEEYYVQEAQKFFA